MSPFAWAIRPLKRYAQFSGRASRAEFWWFFLAVFVLYFVVWIGVWTVLGIAAVSQRQPPGAILGSLGAMFIILGLFWLAILIPSIAVQVRRLHDTNRSGWWLGAFWLLYFAYIILTLGIVGSAMRTAIGGAADPPFSRGLFGGAMLFGFVFFIYSIALFVFYCLPGTKGPNKYGEDPYGGRLDEVFA